VGGQGEKTRGKTPRSQNLIPKKNPSEKTSVVEGRGSRKGPQQGADAATTKFWWIQEKEGGAFASTGKRTRG